MGRFEHGIRWAKAILCTLVIIRLGFCIPLWPIQFAITGGAVAQLLRWAWVGLPT